ncbi:MAG: ATP-dependent DNA helicase RecG [Gammaproteobacteria bacterium]|nr:ATP-dependent DNA helicase RecG [Gammaproteobacteria bacterium]MBU1624187.1 ATP-dependent DNA helicase RecG [Gammaproteobacteria bacterium]MBU1981915.1 ATP-dependent DNA helicase RecG [Gammaproteobacteria bacterium]
MSTPLKIAPATLAKLAKIGIHHRADLLLHLPLRYEDETHITPIAQALPGETVQVQGEVTHCEVMFRPRRTLVCRIQQGDDELTLRFLNFYPSQQKQLAVGKQIRAIGEVRGGFFGLEMVHPKCKSVDDDTPLPQSLSPVYPTTAGLSQTVLRKLIDNALASIPLSDTLPAPLLKRLKLADFGDSLRLLHNPTPDISASTLEARSHSAWRRIKFDELLAQQLSMRVHHRERSKRVAPALPAHEKLTRALLDKLPFQLTGAQQKVWREIAHDLTQSHPMQRLLLGDVGSGKTIVAALAALQAIENGYQVAFMAPTEILAEQHYLKLHEWLAPLGIEPVWLSGSLKKKVKTEAAARISSGDTLLAIGTHALFQKDVEFHKLGLAIIDEQHKFGVQQRLALRNKGKEPHQLMMSATPIPRTLAMSYYADLDVSVIDELPPGRTPIVTKLVSDSRREEVFERVRQACITGRQAYWVCPLIDESEALQLQTALDTHATLSEIFPELRIGLAHGKLSSDEKAATMAAFKAGDLQLLVATTVIEVGVDVPNASLMVIDHAERMGLAQLHQLRGRVGRGAAESMCVLLFQQPLSELARERLRVIYENTDGFVIAQQDLQLRGPGELLGARQSGVAMLRFADISEDEALLETAREIADELLREHPDAARAHLQRWMANKHDFLQV